MTVQFNFDPRDPATRVDPYPAYQGLRESTQASYVASVSTWFIFSHELCLSVLTDKRFSAQQGQRLRQRRSPLPVSMLTTDAPEHTRLRAAAADAFSPTATDGARQWLQPMVEQSVGHLFHRLGGGEEVDVVEAFARPLVTETVARYLGVSDVPAFGAWAQGVAENLDPFADPSSNVAGALAMQSLLEHLADLLYSRSAEPRDDALSVLARSHRQGRLEPGEALSAAVLLVVGGVGPLVDLVTNAVAALVGGVDTSVVRTATGRPSLPNRSRTVVDELLRFDAPIQFVARRATQDVELGRLRVRKGEHVVAMLGSANRDAARFETPEGLDLSRRANPHLSFGAGAHVCLGAPLVRLFSELIWEQLPSPCPELTLGNGPVVRSQAVVPRGFLHLPVRLRDQP